MTYASGQNAHKRMAIFGSVAVLHAGAFYLLATGFAGVLIMIEPPTPVGTYNVPVVPVATPTARATARPLPKPLPFPANHPDPTPTLTPAMPIFPLPPLGDQLSGDMPRLQDGGGLGLMPTPSPSPSFTPQGAVPRGQPGDWITADDYPAQDLREENAGVTGFRLTVDADGRVQGCDITRSSGHSSLDTATCQLVSRRARFKPATDDTGAATTGSYRGQVRWVIPQR